MKPALFNTEMVQAIQRGQKRSTKRPIKPQPVGRVVSMDQNSRWPGYFGEAGSSRVIKPPCHEPHV